MKMTKRFINDSRRYSAYAFHAAKAQLKSRVNLTYLNWIWLFLEPFCFMLVYSFIIGVVFRSNEPYRPVFIYIGLTLWGFFNRTILSSTHIVKDSKGLIVKTYIPKYVLLYTQLLRNGFSSMISFSLIFCMMPVFHVPFTWNILYAIPILILLAVGTFALSSILLHFGTFIADLSHAMPIVLRIVFYMTGVFYSVATRVPAPYGQLLLYYNPIAFIINEMRNVLLFGTALNLKWYFIWLGISLAVSAIGVRLIYTYEDKYAKVI